MKTFSKKALVFFVSALVLYTFIAVIRQQKPIGKIDYVLIDRSNDTIISEGKLTFYQSDISVARARGMGIDSVKKEVQLHPNFSLGISIHREKPDFAGFGLTLINKSERSSSWDWFEVFEKGKAAKLQGNGHIAFSVRPSDGFVEIDNISFTSDTTLRCYRLSEIDSSDPDWMSHPHWVCEIKKGSYIHWGSTGSN
jgi:hypothetical protein